MNNDQSRSYDQSRPHDRGRVIRQPINGVKRDKEPAFRLRVTLDLDMDLAFELGNLILDSNCDNSALLAIGHQIIGS